MTNAYTEDQLVEQPAIGLFAELGWQTVSALEEFFGRSRGDETHLSLAESQSLLTSSPTICLGREVRGYRDALKLIHESGAQNGRKSQTRYQLGN